MRSTFFVTASVLSSLFIGIALATAVLTHAAAGHDRTMLLPMRVIQN